MRESVIKKCKCLKDKNNKHNQCLAACKKKNNKKDCNKYCKPTHKYKPFHLF